MASEQIPLRRKALYILAIHALVLVPLVVYLELVTWWLGGASQAGSYIVSSQRLNHTFKPNSEWLHQEWMNQDPEWREPYLHQYNSEGWIETYDVELSKPADVYRIFYVGDSFVEGTAPMSDSLPSLVETGLGREARRRGSALRYEVINTGTSSYSPLLYYLLIQFKLLDYDPDLIVINVDMTDDFDDWKYRRTAIFDEAGRPLASPPRDVARDIFVDTRDGVVRATWLTRTQLLLAEHSNFFRYLQHALAGASPRNTPDSTAATSSADADIYPRWAWCQDEWDAMTQENVGQTFDTLRADRLALARGGRRVDVDGRSPLPPVHPQRCSATASDRESDARHSGQHVGPPAPRARNARPRAGSGIPELLRGLGADHPGHTAASLLLPGRHALQSAWLRPVGRRTAALSAGRAQRAPANAIHPRNP